MDIAPTAQENINAGERFLDSFPQCFRPFCPLAGSGTRPPVAVRQAASHALALIFCP
jgi:hypothetical protein